MGTVVSVLVRALIVIWCVETMNHMMEVDYETRRLQRKIEAWRKLKERVDTHVIQLESKYQELVL